MKISLNWLKNFVDVSVSDEELIRLIGARLVEVEGVIDETHKYDNIWVVKVVSAEKIPDTHLTICQIDVGGEELVQVVCGAPNVREGMLAVWIAPGAIVPASVHEDAPFVIGKRKMLGKYESNGMLAGADELDFGDDHSGIVEINPEDAMPGVKLADVFSLNDLILEIENKSLTHRPDCFGMIGFAREVAGILGEEFSFVSSPRPSGPSPWADGANSRAGALRNAPRLKEISSLTVSGSPRKTLFERHSRILDIDIASPEICERYSAVVLEKHGEMKKKYLTWQDTILAKSGMRPVDEIVDATNYLMLLTGQPLHAFDYDKFVKIGGANKPKIIVRLAREGEKITLLDEKEIELKTTDVVITSNDVPVALAGAMGGKLTEIDENTRNVIIESATFSLYNLRKTQMEHGIFSEAITRFTKGQPPYQTLVVANMCAEMLSDGFRVAGVADEYPRPEKEIKVNITVNEIDGLLGTAYDKDLIVKTLKNVGFKIIGKKDELEVVAPEWRTDIHIKEDIIEEVGRLLGYDNIEPTLPLHGTADKNKMLQVKKNIRDIMKSYGANELLTYSFVSERLLKKAGLDVENSYKIINSISPDLQLVRQTLIPSLLEKAFVNQKIPFDKFAIFEMNKVYQKGWGLNDESVPVEKMHMGFVVAERKTSGTAYYKAKFFVEKLLEELNVAMQFVSLKMKSAESLPFEEKRSAEIWVNEQCIGVVGEFKNSVRHNYKLAEYLAGFEIDLDAVMEIASMRKVHQNFEVKRQIDETITTKEDYAKTLAKLQLKYPGAEITPVGIYQPEGKEEKNITFHLEFR